MCVNKMCTSDHHLPVVMFQVHDAYSYSYIDSIQNISNTPHTKPSKALVMPPCSNCIRIPGERI